MLYTLATLIVLGASILLGTLGLRAWMHKATSARIPDSLADLPPEARFVVLGCPPRAPDGKPNRYFTARVAAAAAAYHHALANPDVAPQPGCRIFCSGWDRRDEMTPLVDALVAAKVPRDALELDRRATRTIDSIERIALRFPGEPIVFVSQAFHLPRVLYLAQAHGVDAWGLRAAGRLHGIKPALREAVAQLRSVIDRHVRLRRS
jgi:SanA protein